jgi:uncharacterized OsmC-like protein
MNVNTRYVDGVQFVAETRGHQIVCDQPKENHGQDAGMTPPELLLASLGTCAGFYAAQYLKTRNLPTDGLEVNVSAGKASGPARMTDFVVEVKTSPLEPRHQEGILRAVHACLVHNTLLHTPSIQVKLANGV